MFHLELDEVAPALIALVEVSEARVATPRTLHFAFPLRVVDTSPSRGTPAGAPLIAEGAPEDLLDRGSPLHNLLEARLAQSVHALGNRLLFYLRRGAASEYEFAYVVADRHNLI